MYVHKYFSEFSSLQGKLQSIIYRMQNRVKPREEKVKVFVYHYIFHLCMYIIFLLHSRSYGDSRKHTLFEEHYYVCFVLTCIKTKHAFLLMDATCYLSRILVRFSKVDNRPLRECICVMYLYGIMVFCFQEKR